MKVVLVAFAMGLVGLGTREVRACAPPMNHMFEVVPDASDREPPTRLAVRSRTERVDRAECRFHFLVIEASAKDDRPGPLGFQFRIARGTPPEGFFLPSGPVASFDDRYPFFSLGDGPYSFAVGVRAVDRAGNLGPERVFEVASDAAGSSAGRRLSTTLLVGIGIVGVLVVVALVAVLRRRDPRARRSPSS